MRSVYVHIPFCEQRCTYCHFLTFARKDIDRARYFENICKEINLYATGEKIETVFFGGGTPGFVEPEYIKKVLMSIRKSFELVDTIEITLEANPESVTKEKLLAWKDMGINRLSLGLQAVQDKHLKQLGRMSGYEKAQEVVSMARNVGLNNINIDLMFALPNQTLSEWVESLDKTIALSPTHISTYSLEFHQGTILEGLRRKKVIKVADEESDRLMMRTAERKMGEAGFGQYEISNFAHKGFECKHNLNFWQNGEYYGFGLGADGFLNQATYHNVETFEGYDNLLSDGVKPVKDSYRLSNEDLQRDYLILGLRLNRGVPLDSFSNHVKPLGELLEKGLVEKIDKRVRLTEKGRDLENLVMETLV